MLFRSALKKGLLASFDRIPHYSGVELVIVASSLEESEKKYSQVLQKLERLQFRFSMAIGSSIATASTSARSIQVSRRFTRDIEEALSLPNLDCCSVLFSGRQVICSDRALRAFNKKIDRVHPYHYNRHSRYSCTIYRP